MNFVLQRNSDLGTTGWTDAAEAAITVYTNLTQQLTSRALSRMRTLIPGSGYDIIGTDTNFSTADASFYRLKEA